MQLRMYKTKPKMIYLKNYKNVPAVWIDGVFKIKWYSALKKLKPYLFCNRQKSVHIKSNCDLENVKISNTIIDEVMSTKLLGVIM